jgi:hypothetical protein
MRLLMPQPVKRIIMADKRIMQMRDRQQRVFRIASDPTRYGLTLKLIAADSGLHYDSVRAYAAGETTMPMTAFSALIDVIPDELLSYLVGKDRAIVRVPDAIDHDEIEDACRDYLETKGRAHHKNSPAGRELSDCEREALAEKAVPLRVAK